MDRTPQHRVEKGQGTVGPALSESIMTSNLNQTLLGQSCLSTFELRTRLMRIRLRLAFKSFVSHDLVIEGAILGSN